MDSETFVANLERSRRDVNAFALALERQGVRALIPPQRTSPTKEERYDYVDAGDLFVLMRVEHKVRDLDFTCREDFPYGTVIVDEAYKVDSKDADPVLMYVLENRARTHAAVIYGWTRQDWRIEEMFDRARNRVCRNYTCDKKRVRFCRTEDVLWTGGRNHDAATQPTAVGHNTSRRGPCGPGDRLRAQPEHRLGDSSF